MDKITKKIFKCIYKNDDVKSISDLRIKFPNIPIELINQSYNELSKENLITTNLDGAHLTIKGKDYFRNNRINVIKYILNSVIVPIVVSISTTLLTIWLSGLFPKE